MDRALETGPLQDAGSTVTCSGCGSVYVPLRRCPGSETESAASAAELTTLAVVVATYSRATPGWNAPNVAGGPSVSVSVAGTDPPTSIVACGLGTGCSAAVESRVRRSIPAR